MKLQDKIIILELKIFTIKININSGQHLSNYGIQSMINERLGLKKELSNLKRVLKLKTERREKLNKIFKNER